MKRTLTILASYSRQANDKVISIFEEIPEERLKQDMNAYYKSILGTFIHMTMADMNWFMRWKNLYPASVLAKSAALQATVADWQERVGNNYRDIFILRRTADELFVTLVNELTEEDFNRVINYNDKRGNTLANKLGYILLHLFNHHTHHRGAISTMLDMQGIDNDYSGLFKYPLADGSPL